MKLFICHFSFISFHTIYQWFSTFFVWRHTFHQKIFCGTPKTRKILKIPPKNFCFCIKLLGFENCHETKIINSWKSELKSQGKIFGGTPRRSSRHTGWETLQYTNFVQKEVSFSSASNSSESISSKKKFLEIAVLRFRI